MPCSASLCNRIPTAGSAPEFRFSARAATSSSWTWVEFALDHNRRWFGSFRGGSGGECKVVVGRSDLAIVLARGCGYIVDIPAHALRAELPDTSYQDVVSIPQSDLFAVATLTEVVVVNSNGVLWQTQRLAWDGIRMTCASPTEVQGLADDWGGRS